MLLLSRPEGTVDAGTALSLPEYLGLPEDTRCEIVDGVLRPMVRPSKLHRRVQRRLANALEAALPAGLRVEEEEIVVLIGDPPTARIPDITVFDKAADPAGWTNHTQAHLVRLVVEVESRSTRSADRHEKPAEYAVAGVPSYWRIEVDPVVSVHVYRLVDPIDGVPAAYELVATSGQGERLTDPGMPWFAVDVDELWQDLTR